MIDRIFRNVQNSERKKFHATFKEGGNAVKPHLSGKLVNL